MNRIVKVTRLHLNKPQLVFSVPLQIIGLVLLITAIIAFALQRGGLDPADPDYADGARLNMGMIWSLPGFLVYLGVQAVSTTFPFALALGTNRRNYVVGTALANLIQAAYIAVIMSLLLIVELATDHWFYGVYALDVYGLGAGNVGVLALTVFLGTFAALTIGGAFGAVWVRYGSKGPTIVALVLALLLATTLLILAPYLGDIIATLSGAAVALAAIVIALVALAGTWLCMRHASVR